MDACMATKNRRRKCEEKENQSDWYEITKMKMMLMMMISEGKRR